MRESVSGEQFHDVVRQPSVGFKPAASDKLVRIRETEVSPWRIEQDERVFDLCIEEHLIKGIRKLLANSVSIIQVESSTTTAFRVQRVSDW